MATFFSTNPGAAPAGPFVQSAVQEIALGSKFVDQNGNAYRYCKVGGTATVAGKLYQAPAEITDHQNLAPAAAAIGATSVTVTLGATATTANQYAEGYMMVTVTPGEGYKYLIKSNPVIALSTAGAITLSDPLQVALTTSSRVDLVSNPYNGVIVNPATATSCPVGVAVDVVTAGYYGWLQVGGVANVLMNGTGVVGTFQCASNAVAGAVEPFTGVQAPVGICVTGIADTEYGAVKLTFDVG
jgi:hypothetical protein